MTTLITLVLPIGGDAGPFNLSSNVGGYAIPFETNIPALTLTAGYTTSAVPDGTTIIRVTSTGLCTNYIDIPVSLTPTTTTTSSSSSSTSTTTSTAVPTTTTTSSSTSSSTSTSTSTTVAPTTTTTTTEEGPTACNCQTVTWAQPAEPTWTGITNFQYVNCEGLQVDDFTTEFGSTDVCARDGSITFIPYPDGDGSGSYDLSETPCCATTTTTTTALVQNINYRVTACPNAGIYAGFSYNFPKNGTTHSIGDVVQFIIPGDVDGLIRCGTITSITYPNNAIDASLFGTLTYDCDDVAHCNV